MSPKPEGAKSFLPFIIIGGVLVAIIVAMVLMSRSSDTNATQPSANTNTSASANTPSQAPRVQPGALNPHIRGGEKAVVTLEEFSDFQCPACGGLEPTLRRIEKDYGERVRLVFRNFPLKGHRYAFIAARAAEAAGAQGKFWEMHDAIYANQKEWSDAPEPRTFFDSYATRLGLDVQRFRADMERQDLADRVVADYNRGISLNVGGTPSIFLNGRQLSADDTLKEPNLRAKIEEALSAASK
ncbi:MAG TPA: thioredoxin domain-containing protein [Pyrinomonadaceae bacterium]|nr:thioredoxin domain-containing protein [Pyrinomonadaceae bacterium]